VLLNEAVTRGNVIGCPRAQGAADGDDCCLVALKQQRRRARTRAPHCSDAGVSDHEFGPIETSGFADCRSASARRSYSAFRPERKQQAGRRECRWLIGCGGARPQRGCDPMLARPDTNGFVGLLALARESERRNGKGGGRRAITSISSDASATASRLWKRTGPH
jgi:hypothetical protein